METLKYPVGRFSMPEKISPEFLQECIHTLEHFPSQLKAEVEFLTEEQLNTPYRLDGWTIRQVVNHCADSHMNALIRFKFALTEINPTIMPYQQDLWANLPDSQVMDIGASLLLLEGLHARWSFLLKSFTKDDWQKSYIHPEKGKKIGLEEATASYAWHCRHHLAHVTALKRRMGWK